jgi:gamma-glutamyl-gamma-aminobutyraldehyde dehydrogenase
MSDLLTAGEYKAIAETMEIGGNAFVDGISRPAISGETFKTVNPATGKELAAVAACGKADVDFAVQKAREAFEDGRWRSLAPAERKRTLIAFARLIERNRHELAVLESLDSGKPVAECQTIDLHETVNTIRWHAELIDKIYDSTAPVGQGATALVVREPIGVVACVLPWNFPLLMMAWKIGPALASGCSVIVKPAEETSLTAIRLAELAFEAGIPAGVLSVVTGSGPDVGEPIGLHPGIDMVSFTGSTETGKRFLRYAADSNMKRIVLECGGKNPAVVFDDAEDLDLVAEQVVLGAFWNMGENCSATSRLIVHEKVKDELLKRIKAYMRDWRMGDPLDPSNRVGALVSPAHFEKVKSYIDKISSEKLKLVGGGKTQGGIFVEPTVVDGVTPDSSLFQEEVFGPLLSVTTFSNVSQAIALANDSAYGLAASVYTSNLKRALRTARDIRAGTVTVNCFGEGDITTPFGGFKESGFGGRDKSIFAHDQYTELKTIWIDTSDRSVDETVR